MFVPAGVWRLTCVCLQVEAAEGGAVLAGGGRARRRDGILHRPENHRSENATSGGKHGLNAAYWTDSH